MLSKKNRFELSTVEEKVATPVGISKVGAVYVMSGP
jgi:hypothetical protein